MTRLHRNPYFQAAALFALGFVLAVAFLGGYR